MTFVLAKDRMLLNICHGGGLGNRLLEGKDKLAFKIKSHINNTILQEGFKINWT